MAAISSATTSAATCRHCQNPVDLAVDGEFCCEGCAAVYALLNARHLDRYYELRGGPGRAVARDDAGRRDHKWIDRIEADLKTKAGGTRIELDIQGMHCSACVWLVETLFRDHPGGGRVLVNPALGRLDVTATPSFDVRRFVEDVERFGYRLGPPVKSGRRASTGLLARMGVCIAIAMNSMIFGIAIYAGLVEGPIHALFLRLNFALSVVSVAVGGTVFFRAAWQGLRRRVLHMDLPIALGILLAFAGSTHAFFTHNGEAEFFDTLNVFIALMLVGRFLQERVLEKNRLTLLASDGVDGLLARRIRDGVVETVKCAELACGDVLLLAPGDLVPVDARLRAERGASFSLDWINGESAPRVFRDTETIPAGAFFAGVRAIEVVAAADFAESPLVALLRTPLPRDADAASATPWWQRFAKIYVVAVLAAAFVGFAAWMLRTGDVGKSMGVATAVLIVTCPCAFGIATPLAYDLVQAGLRRAGLFVRSPGFLDRAALVRTVVFDKTGTLTSGRLTVRDPAALVALAPEHKKALGDLVARSNHPKSLAVLRALGGDAAAYDASARVHERAGRGLELVRGARCYRIGSPSWVAPNAPHEGDVVFGVDGRLLADVVTIEERRPDARREVGELGADGYDVWLLSGDAQGRVEDAARDAGVRLDHAVGDRSPSAKAEWVRAHDRRDLLMVGDGINDSLVVSEAYCSGTPAVDRPFMAARSDFYFVSPGLRPVRLALHASRALARIRRANLGVAFAYNVLAVGLAYAGLMSPLVCAVIMPASSLTTIAVTALRLSPRRPLWRS